MTISPILFPIWLDILLKDKFSSIGNCTINKFIHQLTCYHHCQDWWRKPSKRTEKIMHQSPISFMLTMLLLRILLLWRQLLVKKPWLKKTIHISNSWRDSKKSSFHKVNMSQEDCMIHWIWLGNYFLFILNKVFQRFQMKSLKNITRKGLMRMKMKIRKIEIDSLKFILFN